MLIASARNTSTKLNESYVMCAAIFGEIEQIEREFSSISWRDKTIVTAMVTPKPAAFFCNLRLFEGDDPTHYLGCQIGSDQEVFRNLTECSGSAWRFSNVTGRVGVGRATLARTARGRVKMPDCYLMGRELTMVVSSATYEDSKKSVTIS